MKMILGLLKTLIRHALPNRVWGARSGVRFAMTSRGEEASSEWSGATSPAAGSPKGRAGGHGQRPLHRRVSPGRGGAGCNEVTLRRDGVALRGQFHTLLALVALFAVLAAAPPASAAPGDLDPLDANITGAAMHATAVQPDGKTIIAGNFTQVLGVARNGIARLNADAMLDTTFNPNANNPVYSVAVQADGKLLLGGFFTALQR